MSSSSRDRIRDQPGGIPEGRRGIVGDGGEGATHAQRPGAAAVLHEGAGELGGAEAGSASRQKSAASAHTTTPRRFRQIQISCMVASLTRGVVPCDKRVLPP